MAENGTPAAASARVVLITGCSKGGIGASLCEEFAEQGFRVYATARRLESMQFAHKGVCKRELDVDNDAAVLEVVQDVVEQEGRIDVLVSNAGLLCIGAMLDIPISQVKATFDTNVFATLRLARAVIPHMAKRKQGLIMTIGSVAGEVPTPWNGIYCATKSALHAITEMLSMECAPLGVHAMLVMPASVRSNLAQNHTKLFRMPDGSLWKPYADRIIARMHLSQGANSMPTADFSHEVVRQALRPSPPTHFRIGGGSYIFALLGWLPRWVTLRLMWRWLGKTTAV